MKRTALVRRTPLKPGAPLKATSGLRRGKPLGAGRKARAGTPSGDERTFVLTRDRECIARKLYRGLAIRRDPGPCFDEWGNEIRGDFRIADLVYGHARTEAGGLRPTGADGEGRKWAVAECHHHNDKHWEAQTEPRQAINVYLDRLYPGRRNPAP